MKVAIVNDLSLALEVLKRVVNSANGLTIAWLAKDGKEAFEKCQNDPPDIILMDLIMPIMDGAESTRQIMLHCPVPILVVTASVGANYEKVFEAMSNGALDAVSTPTLTQDGFIEGGNELLKKIEIVARISGKKFDVSQLDSFVKVKNTPIIAIGSSTGGPKALATILSGLPKVINVAIVITQHIDNQFVKSLVSWLDSQISLDVKLIEPGTRPEKNTVYLASTYQHIFLSQDQTINYKEDPKDYPYKPSINEFFTSLANNSKNPYLAMLLTGMGNDGAEGLLQLSKSGWTTIAQSKESCVIFGMPKVAIQLGAAQHILDLEAMPEFILKYIKMKETL